MTSINNKYFPRRRFIKAFISELISVNEEIHGIKNISLNRLNELPRNEINQIVPVMFKDINWKVSPDKKLQLNKNGVFRDYRMLDNHELYMLNQMEKHLSLHTIGNKLSDEFNIDPIESLNIVSGFFFEMASLMICHPEKQYDFDNSQE